GRVSPASPRKPLVTDPERLREALTVLNETALVLRGPISVGPVWVELDGGLVVRQIEIDLVLTDRALVGAHDRAQAEAEQSSHLELQARLARGPARVADQAL